MSTDSPATDNSNKTLDLADDSTGKEAKTKATPADAVTDAEKKIRRAERFGITVKLSEEEKRSSRAERFGTISSTNGGSSHGSEGPKQSEEIKRKARAERFGVSAPTDNDDAKKKARLEKFGSIPKTDVMEEDKRKARALRFSQAPENAIALNGNDTIEPKAAIASNASGGS